MLVAIDDFVGSSYCYPYYPRSGFQFVAEIFRESVRRTTVHGGGPTSSSHGKCSHALRLASPEVAVFRRFCKLHPCGVSLHVSAQLDRFQWQFQL